MSDEWGTIDQSDVGIHIVVEISWGTMNKELPIPQASPSASDHLL